MTTAASPAAGTIVVLVATSVEARPLRRRLRGHHGVTVVRAGIGAASRAAAGATVISCGLAGGLTGALPSGLVIIPDQVGEADGTITPCSAPLVGRLRAAADRLGVPWHSGPLVTVDHVVRGTERALWAEHGYVAVDMETAPATTPDFAAVRVLLDTPARELSPAWGRPGRALLTPQLWGQALWLARVAPRHADLAARVVAAAVTGRKRAR